MTATETATARSAGGVLDAVRELLPSLRERAQETEDLRRIPDENIKALQDTGFFRLLQPRRYDGLEASPVDFYRGVRLIASACGSTGWVSSVIGVHPWQLGHLRRPGPAGGVGRRPADAGLVVVRADGPGDRGRRRLHLQRAVELLVRVRPRAVDLPRRPGHGRRGHAGRLPHVPAAARRLRDRGRLGHHRPARHRLATTSSSRTRSSPSTAR